MSSKNKSSKKSSDAAVAQPNQLGIAPPQEIEYGRFPDAKRHFGLTRSKVYDLIWSGAIKSCVVKKKGARHGVRLLDMASIRDFLRSNTR